MAHRTIHMRWHLSKKEKFLYVFIYSSAHHPRPTIQIRRARPEKADLSWYREVCVCVRTLWWAGQSAQSGRCCVRWGGGSRLWRQVKYTVGGSAFNNHDTRTRKRWWPAVYLYYTTPVRCWWCSLLSAVVGLCVLLLCIIRTAHIFRRREREREKIISSDYSVFGTGFHCCGALSWFFRRCQGGALSFHSLSGGNEEKRGKIK